MYKDTEQSYGDWTLDVYEAYGKWHCDFWHRSHPDQSGVVSGSKRKEVIAQAKNKIDRMTYDPT